MTGQCSQPDDKVDKIVTAPGELPTPVPSAQYADGGVHIITSDNHLFCIDHIYMAAMR